jgi:hypothetical protein
MGVRIIPHVGILAAALPHIWATASSHLAAPSSLSNTAIPGSKGGVTSVPCSNKAECVNSEDTGAVVRLHSALIAVLTHLVGKLRAVAVQDPHIAGVIFPLLNFSTSLGESSSLDESNSLGKSNSFSHGSASCIKFHDLTSVQLDRYNFVDTRQLLRMALFVNRENVYTAPYHLGFYSLPLRVLLPAI